MENEKKVVKKRQPKPRPLPHVKLIPVACDPVEFAWRNAEIQDIVAQVIILGRQCSRTGKSDDEGREE